MSAVDFFLSFSLVLTNGHPSELDFLTNERMSKIKQRLFKEKEKCQLYMQCRLKEEIMNFKDISMVEEIFIKDLQMTRKNKMLTGYFDFLMTTNI